VCFIDYYIALEIRSGHKARLSLPMMRARCSQFAGQVFGKQIIGNIQPVPAGGSLAGLGKHGGTKPALRRRAGSSMGSRGGK
jgi:hypothetical protein